MGIQCFFVEPIDKARRSLRRYVSGVNAHSRCPGRFSFHNGETILDTVAREVSPGDAAYPRLPDHDISHSDVRWPEKCDGCDYRFVESDEWQVHAEQIYVDRASGVEYRLHDNKPGMMWDAFWMSDYDKGPDGRSLVVVCPNGSQWMIDSQCSNCTLPNDRGPYGVAHRCWTRTGTPPLIQVGKQFGKTCTAGAGSIQAGNYHGFLGKPGHAAPGCFT